MNKKTLSRKQLAVIDDLFTGDFSIEQLLEKHNLSRSVYHKWLGDELFCGEFDRRITTTAMQAKALIAGYSLTAAARLIALTDAENPETARKACLDIISLPKQAADKKLTGADDDSGDETLERLAPELAERLLAALAEQKDSV